MDQFGIAGLSHKRLSECDASSLLVVALPTLALGTFNHDEKQD